MTPNDLCRWCGHTRKEHSRYSCWSGAGISMINKCLCPGFKPYRWWHRNNPNKVNLDISPGYKLSD